MGTPLDKGGRVRTDGGRAGLVTTATDAGTYRFDPGPTVLTMPKLLLNASGDEFFLPDSSQFYFDALRGETHVRYVPNAAHALEKSDALMRKVKSAMIYPGVIFSVAAIAVSVSTYIRGQNVPTRPATFAACSWAPSRSDGYCWTAGPGSCSAAR